jgi:hypothetical protein
MVCILSLGAVYQMHILYQHWRSVPEKNLSLWRLEYADINFDNTSASSFDAMEAINPNIHLLEVQLQASSNALHPMLKKNLQLPNLELLLTNVDGQPIAYQEYTPAEWLGRDAIKDYYLTRGIAAPSQITVKIPLELPEAASGFQVQMVYPN